MYQDLVDTNLKIYRNIPNQNSSRIKIDAKTELNEKSKRKEVCMALYQFEPVTKGDLRLEKGNLVVVLKSDEEGWSYGYLYKEIGRATDKPGMKISDEFAVEITEPKDETDDCGWFPSNYVSKVPENQLHF